ncbi:MAG: restriction endonuclease subunit S [Paenibacillus macerans]|uniref:restriction endonuclease subunit S n=1 Tax=Paenibacillus macerans TaxID=44252 RepID=UPI0024303B39|nr:restriction endonuclease subunit S [Paenibacillus macerans]MBS5913617.1 restriction endonuclease subunit S [Paenibacillus macerans]
MKEYLIIDLLESVISGEWGNEPNGEQDVFVLRTTNFSNNGKIDFSKEVVKRNIDEKKVDAKKLNYGDIIIEKSGGSIDQPVGRVVFYDLRDDTTAYLCNNFTSVLRPNTKLVNPKFLFYFLFYLYKCKAVLKFQNQTTGIINLKLDNYLRNSTISIPMLGEQEHIVKILDKAQYLIEQRKQAIAKLDELVQAVFLDMFGQFSDTNCKIKDVIISLQAGLSTGGETRQKQGSELGVLTTSAVTSGEFIDTAYKVPSEKDIKLNKLVFPTKNSILVSRMNTRELVGASAIIEKDYNDLFIPDRLWKLTLDQRIVNPYYFLFVIQAKKIRDEVSRLSSGTSGSMLNISQEKYLGIDFYLPAKQLQDQFASMIIQIRNTKNKMKLQLQQLESNFQALLQKAFKGELTVKDGVAV